MTLSRLFALALLATLGCSDNFVSYQPTGQTRYVSEKLDHFWEEAVHFRYHIDCEGKGRLAEDVDAYILGHPAPALAIECGSGRVRVIDLATCTVRGEFVEQGIDVRRIDYDKVHERFCLTSTRGVSVVETRPRVELRLVAPGPAQTFIVGGPDAEAKQGWDPDGSGFGFRLGEQHLRWVEDGGVIAQ